MLAGFLAVGINKVLTGSDAIEHALWFQVYNLVVIFIYFAYFWHRSGQTVGMKAWRIKLVNLEDKPVNLKQLIVRWLVAVPSYALCFLGIFWHYWDKDNLNWHDRASHTKLVFLPKSKKK